MFLEYQPHEIYATSTIWLVAVPTLWLKIEKCILYVFFEIVIPENMTYLMREVYKGYRGVVRPL